jgi:hypothetical protein
MSHSVNGRLATWPEVASQQRWSSLFLGNGLSMHLWPGFHYNSLFNTACVAGHLDPRARALFSALGTENFELVLSALVMSITVDETFGREVEELYDEYQSVQLALGKSVRDVHPALEQIAYETRAGVREVLRQYRDIFTTSYDLLLYWCMGAGQGGIESFHGFKDYLWSRGQCEFDPSNVAIAEEWSSRVLYLHGALHLVVGRSGATRKRARGVWSLLDQIGLADPDDPRQRPLLISEGSATDKLRTIQDNDYLRFALRRLRLLTAPMVIFGHSLGDQDAHLVDALNEHRDRPIAVSIFNSPGLDIRARQAEIRRVLTADELYFFDASTHPLGTSAFRPHL